eukprot:3379824-Rhodomonas_salina.1
MLQRRASCQPARQLNHSLRSESIPAEVQTGQSMALPKHGTQPPCSLCFHLIPRQEPTRPLPLRPLLLCPGSGELGSCTVQAPPPASQRPPPQKYSSSSQACNPRAPPPAPPLPRGEADSRTRSDLTGHSNPREPLPAS